jgi:phosphoglycolate phosphatase-like HAD superfamily hydrolase
LTELKLVVFDFDGVIIESNDAKTAAFDAVFARFPDHHAGMMDYHHANVSASRLQKFDELLRRLGRDGDTTLRGELAADFSRRTIDEVVRVPMVPGARELLEELHGRVPVVLASVTPQQDLDIIVERRGLASWFTHVYGCPPWTKSAAIADALQRERRAPTDAVLVGDSPGDQKAAADAGVEFVARDSGITFHPLVPRRHRDLFEVAAFLRPRLP